MPPADKLENLDVWANARSLVSRIYKATSSSPVDRDFVFCKQIRSAAISIMSNIAEGFGRSSDKEFARFLDIARGSGFETQSLLYVGKDVEYVDEETFDEMYLACDKILAQITSLRRYLNGEVRNPRRPVAGPRTQDSGPLPDVIP